MKYVALLPLPAAAHLPSQHLESRSEIFRRKRAQSGSAGKDVCIRGSLRLNPQLGSCHPARLNVRTFRSPEGHFDRGPETPADPAKQRSARPTRQSRSWPTQPTLAQTPRRSTSRHLATANTQHSSARRGHNSKSAPQDSFSAKRESISPQGALPCASAGKSQSSRPCESPLHPIPAASNPSRPLHGPSRAAMPQATPAQTAAAPTRTSKSKQSSRF